MISSHKSLKVSIISAFDSSQYALSNTETGNFLFLSIFTFIIHLFSTSISNQDHFAGIIFKENHSSPEVKNIQVDLIIWFTITLSIQFITNEAVPVINGTHHK
jgi:hypothetical protein